MIVIELYSKDDLIDPRTLILLNIIFSIASFFITSLIGTSIIVIISFILMLIFHMKKDAIKYLFFYFSLILINKLFFEFGFKKIYTFTSLLFYMFSKFIPILMISSIIVNKIKMAKVISGLEKLKVSKGVLIATTVAVRFVPTIKYEINKMKDSLKLREVELRNIDIIIHPIKFIELYFIPVIFRSLKLSEELAATALVRGIESENKRSSIYKIKFSYLDYFFTIITIFILIVVYLFT